MLVNCLLIEDGLFEAHHRENEPVKPCFSTPVISTLGSLVESRQAQYATTLEQDKEIVKSGIKGRAKLATQMRLGEKEILNKALIELEHRLGRLSSNVSHGTSNTLPKRSTGDRQHKDSKRQRKA